MILSLLQEQVHKLAIEKGWWEEGRDVGSLIALIHSELSEALEEYRNGHPLNGVYWKDGKPEGFPIELADVLIRLLDLCQAYGIDLEEAVDIKFRYNATRPYRHGGKVI